MTSQKKKLLITDRFDLQAIAFLKSKGLFEIAFSESPTPTVKELENTNALLIRSRTVISKEFLAIVPQTLELIISSTSGYDHIDLEETVNKKIKVFHTPEANAQSTAELTMFLMLSCARQSQNLQKMIQSGDWKRSELSCFELSGKSLGIIGLGRVGSKVASMAKAFGMDVFAYDPYKDDEHFLKLQVKRLGYTEILRVANVISYHVPYTKETRQMFNRRLFEELNEGMIVINASRGDILNEPDLLFGLESGLIARAGLDVFVKEPLPKDSSLKNHPKIVTTPHVGATTNEAFALSSLLTAQKTFDFFSGQSVTDQLPPQAPWWTYEFRRST